MGSISNLECMYYRIEMGRFISNEYGRAQTLFLIPTTLLPITHVLPAFRRWDLLRQDRSDAYYYGAPLHFCYHHAHAGLFYWVDLVHSFFKIMMHVLLL